MGCPAREASGYKVGSGSWTRTHLWTAGRPTTDPDTSSPSLSTCWPGLLPIYKMEPEPTARPASLGPKELRGA